MTYADAVRKARRIARTSGELVFVILSEPGEQEQPFDTATEEELGTYYAGLSDTRILHCTADDPERLDD